MGPGPLVAAVLRGANALASVLVLIRVFSGGDGADGMFGVRSSALRASHVVAGSYGLEFGEVCMNYI